ncbi:MAG: ABC transporter substrate-binding protein [Janthinobacterium lividum]
MRKTIARLACGLAVWGFITAGAARAEQPPAVIRFGAPALTVDGDTYWGTFGLARYEGWLDQEFGKDHVKFDFVGYRGGAPMVGQALANGQIDFAGQGDLLSIIGRSSGMQTRLILPFDKLSNAYLAVSPKSTIHSIEDLRGKRVAYYKGNQIQLQVIRILAAHGLTEKDIRSIALDPSTAAVALNTGDVDAIFSGQDTLAMRDRGLAKIIYSTQGQPEFTSYNGLIVRADFARQYPQTTERLVKVLVKAAWWASEPANRQEVLRIWGLGPLHRSYIAEDFKDRPWADRQSALLDPLLVAHYKNTEDLIAQLGLLRGPKFDVEQWIDRRYLDQALKDLKLEHYWTPLDAQGKPLVAQ